MTVLLFAILGTAAGAVYALAALGIVVTYRGSGVINFASGAMGMVATFVYWDLHDNNHVPLVFAFTLGLAAAVGLGLVTHLLMRRLLEASMLMRVVLTLALLTVLEGGVELHWQADRSYLAEPILPQTSVRIFNFGVAEANLWLILIAVLLTAGLWAIYRYTRFGLATSATAENHRALTTLGWSAHRISAINWMVGAALAGVAGILISPIDGVSVGIATSLLLPAIAGAVVGNLSSFPLTLAGGVLIGIIQDEVQRFVNVPGITSGVGAVSPFVVLIAVILIRGRRLPLRSYVHERLPAVPSGRLNLPFLLVAVAVVVTLVWTVLPSYWNQNLGYSIVAAIVLESIVVLTGYAGQISLTQWAMGGCGAVITVQLLVHHVPYVIAIFVGVLAVVPIGFIVGVAALRSRGISLALATLGVSALLVATVFADSNLVLGGLGQGFNVGNLNLFGYDIDVYSHPPRYVTFVLAILVLTGLFVANLRRGSTGRRMLAIRSNERAASSLGIDVKSVKLGAFCYSSAIASLGAILSVLTFSLINLSQPGSSAVFTSDPIQSIQLVVLAVLGGVGYVTGSIPGAVGLGGLGVALTNKIPGAANYQSIVTVIAGLATVAIIAQAPDGYVPALINQHRKNAAWIRRRVLRREPAVIAEPDVSLPPPPKAIPALPDRDHRLEVKGLTVRFGAITALSDVSLTVSSGEVVGVIGPNGAGKTTLLDAITGFVPCVSGEVALDGRILDRLLPHERNDRGISRSFQTLELFEDMSVFENLVVACEHPTWSRRIQDGIRPLAPVLTTDAAEAVRAFGLDSFLSSLPSALSSGTRRTVALVRAVATGPSILLLDEPAASLDNNQRLTLRTTIRQLADEHGLGVLLIEHDVDLVCSVSDRVVALDYGQVIASGSPESVRRDPSVITSYIGLSEEVSV